MPTTLKGDLHGFDTEDKCEFSRKAGFYNYSIKASDGGNVHLKIEHYTGDQIGLDADAIKGTWKTIEERIKIESNHSTTGSFSLSETLNANGNGLMRVKFSRGLGTNGVDYEFVMTP
jgi:hypothetical protein